MTGSSLEEKAPALGAGDREFKSRLPDPALRIGVGGLCECGCGNLTRAYYGVPRRFCHGHFFLHKRNQDADIGKFARRQKARNLAWVIIRNSFRRGAWPRPFGSVIKDINSKTSEFGVILPIHSIKRIWTIGYNRGWINRSVDWAINWQQHRHNQRKAFFEKNRDRIRERQREWLIKTRRTHQIRFKKISAEQNLTDFCLNLDAPKSFENDTVLHEAIASPELDPLAALMAKEEAEEEQKYEQWRKR